MLGDLLEPRGGNVWLQFRRRKLNRTEPARLEFWHQQLEQGIRDDRDTSERGSRVIYECAI
ncbi:MAG TPA: hypothetical protein VF963_10165 [Gaiellaceae bacterium]